MTPQERKSKNKETQTTKQNFSSHIKNILRFPRRAFIVKRKKELGKA